jgi:hypothetical protein
MDNHPPRSVPPHDITTDIYYGNLNKNTFIKIAQGSTPMFVPNSDKILFMKGANSDGYGDISIYSINKDGSNYKTLIKPSPTLIISDNNITLSSSGNFLVSMRNPNTYTLSDTYLYNINDSTITNLTEGKLGCRESKFSIDGKKILLNANEGIFLFDIATKNMIMIKPTVDSVYFNQINLSQDNNNVIYIENNEKINKERIRQININNISEDKILFSGDIVYQYLLFSNNNILSNQETGGISDSQLFFDLIDQSGKEIKKTVMPSYFYNYDIKDTNYGKPGMVYFNDYRGNFYILDTSTMTVAPTASPYASLQKNKFQIMDYTSDYNEALYVPNP